MAEPDLEILEMGEELGNTNTSSSPTDASGQTYQYIHHIFTWNNYPTNGAEILIQFFNHFAYDYVFQQEIAPTTGTPHLQGIVSLKKRARWTEFGLPKQISWRKCKSVSAQYEYCSDPNKRYGNCWSLKYPIPVKLKILGEHQLNTWEIALVDMVKAEPNNRTIIWVWSDRGRFGKSEFCKYLAHNFKAVICGKGAYSDIMNIMYNADMNRSNLVVFDLPRNNGNKISYSALESIKNGLIVNTKYETGSKLFNAPHIIVFSNMPPAADSMSSDRWVVMNLDRSKLFR